MPEKPSFDPHMQVAVPREKMEHIARRLKNIALSPVFHSNLGICGIVEAEIDNGNRDIFSYNKACVFTFYFLEDSPHYTNCPQYPVPPAPNMSQYAPQEIFSQCQQHFQAASAKKALWSKSSYYGRTRRAMALEMSNQITKMLTNN